MGPDDPFTIEEFCIIFGLAIVAIIVCAINKFLEDDNRQNQSEERTVAVHAKSCKGAGANVEAFTDQGSSSLNAQAVSLINASLKNRKSTSQKILDAENYEQVKKILNEYINVQDASGSTVLHRNAGLGHLESQSKH